MESVMNSWLTVGIDYSISSPAACVHYGQTWSSINCSYFTISPRARLKETYLANKISIIRPDKELKGVEKYSFLAKATCSYIDAWKKYYDGSSVFIGIEDYAFASTGRVFHIGENGGILKFLMTSSSLSYETFAPATIKKFAAGKGNAKKEQMVEKFEEETNLNLMNVFEMKTLSNPIDDIADSYFICKKMFEIIKERNDGQKENTKG